RDFHQGASSPFEKANTIQEATGFDGQSSTNSYLGTRFDANSNRRRLKELAVLLALSQEPATGTRLCERVWLTLASRDQLAQIAVHECSPCIGTAGVALILRYQAYVCEMDFRFAVFF